MVTPDRAAIDAVTTALRNRAAVHDGWDFESVAAVAVTTLQGLGWRPPSQPPTVHTLGGCTRLTLPPGTGQRILDAFNQLREQIAAMPEPTQADFTLAPPPAREEP